MTKWKKIKAATVTGAHGPRRRTGNKTRHIEKTCIKAFSMLNHRYNATFLKAIN